MNINVLVTGATGNIGSRVTRILNGRPDTFARALVRDVAKGEALAAIGCDVAFGSFDDPVVLARAVEGIDTIVLITPPCAQAALYSRAVYEAAEAGGVRKIVRVSAIKADSDGPTENTRLHAESDSELAESGLNYVILRPNFFMQNLFLYLEAIRRDGVLYAGMGDARLAMIDVRDVVDCVCVAVLSEQFDNEILELSGPASISFHDVVTALNEYAPQAVTYVAVSPEAVKGAMLEAGFDEWTATLLCDYARAFRGGWGDFVTANVERLSGHRARTISQFVAEELSGSLL